MTMFVFYIRDQDWGFSHCCHWLYPYSGMPHSPRLAFKSSALDNSSRRGMNIIKHWKLKCFTSCFRNNSVFGTRKIITNGLPMIKYLMPMSRTRVRTHTHQHNNTSLSYEKGKSFDIYLWKALPTTVVVQCPRILNYRSQSSGEEFQR